MRFKLGEWTVEEDANRLVRRDEVVRVEKRVMAVLVHLAKANGAVVSKDALIDAVWHGAAVSDHSVANAISDLRRILGDDRRHPKYIETIPKRGYRVLADIQDITESNEEQESALAKFPPRKLTLALAGFCSVDDCRAVFPVAPARRPAPTLLDGHRKYDWSGDARKLSLRLRLKC